MPTRFALIGILLAVCSYLFSSSLPAQGDDRRTTSKPTSPLAEQPLPDEDLKKVVENLQQALNKARKSADHNRELRLLNEIGKVHEKTGQHTKALEYYNKALTVSTRIRHSEGEAVSLNNIGRWYSRHGPLERALDFYEKALEIRKRLDDLDGQATTLRELAAIYKLLEQHQRQLQCCEDVLEIRQMTRDIKGRAAAMADKATVHIALREYQKAQELLGKALITQKGIGDAPGLATTLNKLACLKMDQGHYKRALELCDEGLSIEEKSTDSNIAAMLLRTKALVADSLGQYEEAWNLAAKALSHSRVTGDRSSEIEALSTIAKVHVSLGFMGKALRLYEDVLSLATANGDAFAEASTLQDIAETHVKNGEDKEAAEFYEKALAARKGLGVPTDALMEAMLNVYLKTDDTKKAKQLISQFQPSNFVVGRFHLQRAEYGHALDKLSIGDDPNLETRFATSALRGLVYEGQGKHEDAIRSFKDAIDHVEQIRETLTEVQRRNLFNVEILGVPRILPYEGLSRIFLKAAKPYESFKYAEMTKARAFADSLVRRARVNFFGVPQNILDEDLEINEMFSELMIAKANSKGDFDTDHLGRLRARRDSHLRKVRHEYPIFAATKYPQPMDLPETALKDEEWVLEYEVTESGVGIFLIRGKTILKSLFKSIPRKELDTYLRTFREPLEIIPGRDNITDKLKSFDFGSGKKLSDVLLGDIIKDLPRGAPVIVVPDASLGVLPFEMLVLNARGEIKTDKKFPHVIGAEFFGDRNPVSYYQSVTALTLARTLQKKGNPAERLFVIADPVFQLKDQRAQGARSTKIAEADKKFYSELMATYEQPAGGGLRFNRLPLTGELATSLKELFKGQSDCYIGVDATKETLLKTVAPKMDSYGSLVFATHGYFNKNNPGFLEPILALTMVPPGTDGFLRMSEVMGLKLNADIVALTACQTGLGRNISGEGTMGMGRAFQYAGAKSVLMSLWNVEQKASVQLVESFFRHRKAGKNKLKALRLARTEIRNDGYDHPFFWAPFILVGEVD